MVNSLTTSLNIFTAYILILLWIDMNLLEVKSNVYNTDKVSLPNSELIEYSINPGNMIKYFKN